MPLPNFFVIGAARAGTTALYEALAQHPEVFMAPVKEPYFFALDRDSPARAGAPFGPSRRGVIWEPHRYLALFSGAAGQRAVGEASAIYLSSADAAQRIRHNIPNAKLVSVLRQPAERAHSHYRLMVWAGIERAPTFEDALAQERSRISAGWFPENFYRARGFYHAQLSRYFDLFGPEQIRSYLYEDWRDSPRDLLQSLFGFLGVDPSFAPELHTSNTTRASKSRRLHQLALSTRSPWLNRIESRLNSAALPPMRRETRLRLLDDYRGDITKLQDLIGRDLSPWLDESRDRQLPPPRSETM